MISHHENWRINLRKPQDGCFDGWGLDPQTAQKRDFWENFHIDGGAHGCYDVFLLWIHWSTNTDSIPLPFAAFQRCGLELANLQVKRSMGALSIFWRTPKNKRTARSSLQYLCRPKYVCLQLWGPHGNIWAYFHPINLFQIGSKDKHHQIRGLCCHLVAPVIYGMSNRNGWKLATM